jgi:hypothetical protein
MLTVNRTTTAHKPRLWVVCCEQTEVTQQISEAVAQWQLPEVRSLFAESLGPEVSSESRLSEAVAQSDYAIFITPYSQPSPHIKISPLNLVEPDNADDYLDSDHPVGLLSDLHSRYGQSPQSWWLQLPTTEVRARRICPVASQKSVAQALKQIGIFVRHYRLVSPQKRSTVPAAKAINNQPKVSAKQLVVSH